jgi:hypothetical protein
MMAAAKKPEVMSGAASGEKEKSVALELAKQAIEAAKWNVRDLKSDGAEHLWKEMISAVDDVLLAWNKLRRDLTLAEQAQEERAAAFGKAHEPN